MRLKALFGEIKNVENDRKKEFEYSCLADVKQAAEEKYETFKTALEASSGKQSGTDLDLTAPSEAIPSRG